MRKRTGAAKQALITELRLHKLRAKKFFQLLKYPRDPETITVSFDIQKNQPLLKLSISEVFYARQVWLYNLTAVRQTDDNTQSKADVSIYTWLETEAGRGSNEVASPMHDYLSKLRVQSAWKEWFDTTTV